MLDKDNSAGEWNLWESDWKQQPVQHLRLQIGFGHDIL